MSTHLQVSSLSDYIDANERAFAEYGELVADLSDEQWALPSLCPAWDLRGCMAHAIGVEKVLTGWGPSLEEPPRFDLVEAWTTEAAAMSGPEFLAEVDAVTAARQADLRSRDDSVVDAQSLTPVGPQKYGDFLRIRIFDLWVHARDIAIPLGVELPDGGSNASLALDEVHRSMGYIVGKLVGLPDGMSVTVNVTGGVARDIHVAVDGRAGLVENLDNPSTVVAADTETIIMLACGRIDPQERIDAGRISWSGNSEWGERVARSLRFTM